MLQKTQLLYEDSGKKYREELKGYRSGFIGFSFFKELNGCLNCCLMSQQIWSCCDIWHFFFQRLLQINTGIFGMSDSGFERLTCLHDCPELNSSLPSAHTFSGWCSIGWGECVSGLVGIGCGLVAECYSNTWFYMSVRLCFATCVAVGTGLFIFVVCPSRLLLM